MKHCLKCGNPTRTEDFYKRSDRKCTYSECKKCFNRRATLRDQQNKLQAVTFMGGKCQHCGYFKCIRALEFHHKDRTLKSPLFKNSGWRKWSWEKVKKELEKCILLCANCHREEEESLALSSNT